MNVRPSGGTKDRALGDACRTRVERLIQEHLPDVAQTVRVEGVLRDGSIEVRAPSEEALSRLRFLLTHQMQTGDLEHLGHPFAEQKVHDPRKW